jgi:hypothetical protein
MMPGESRVSRWTAQALVAVTLLAAVADARSSSWYLLTSGDARCENAPDCEGLPSSLESRRLMIDDDHRQPACGGVITLRENCPRATTFRACSSALSLRTLEIKLQV